MKLDKPVTVSAGVVIAAMKAPQTAALDIKPIEIDDFDLGGKGVFEPGNHLAQIGLLVGRIGQNDNLFTAGIHSLLRIE